MRRKENNNKSKWLFVLTLHSDFVRAIDPAIQVADITSVIPSVGFHSVL